MTTRSRRSAQDAVLSVLALTITGFCTSSLAAGTTLTPLPLPDGACGMRPVARGAFAGDTEPVFNAITVPRAASCLSGDGRAVRWDGSTWQDIGPEGGFNTVNGVHPSGRAAGAFGGTGGPGAFTWSAATGPLVLTRGADASNANALAVNADGTAVGFELLSSSRVTVATAWTPGGGATRLLDDFDPAPGAIRSSRATAVGDGGAIAGEWRRYPAGGDAADSVPRVFRVESAGAPVEDLFGLSEREPQLVVLSVGGPWRVIAGDLAYDTRAWAGNVATGDIEPVLIEGNRYVYLADANREGRSVYESNGDSWLRDVDGTLRPLPGPSGSRATSVSDLADSGQSVGEAILTDGTRRALSWSPDGAVTDLNDVLPADAPAGLLLTSAVSVSETGAIVARDADGGWWLLASDAGGEPGSSDADGDGVDDAADLCPATELGVEPTVGATKNRYYATVDGRFVDGRGTVSSITIVDTGGCSGQQIVAEADLSSSNLRYGIWIEELERWVVSLRVDGPEGDADEDGVPNAADLCPATKLGVEPTVRATKNRYYATVDGLFVDGRGTVSSITVVDTGGCSGQQIVAEADLSSSNLRYGIWIEELERWAEQLRAH